MKLTDDELRSVLDALKIVDDEYGIDSEDLSLSKRIACHLGEYKENLYWLDRTAWWKRNKARELVEDIREARRPQAEKNAEAEAAQAKRDALSPGAKKFMAAAKACSRPTAEREPEPPQEVARRLPKRRLKPTN